MKHARKIYFYRTVRRSSGWDLLWPFLGAMFFGLALALAILLALFQ